MPQAAIRSIRLLRDLGIFGDFTPAANLPPFRNLNLIYGFNGSGKTTLSRVFSSLEHGTRHDDIAPTAIFQIELSDGTLLKSDESFDQLKGRLLVLNVDFIQKNLRWSEGAANPIFYIGEEQAGAAQKLKETREKLALKQASYGQALSNRAAKQRSFDDFKRDTARTIAEALDLGRRYIATHLEADYSTQSYDSHSRIDEEKILPALQKQMRDTTPVPQRQIIKVAQISLEEITKKTKDTLSSTAGTLAIEELQKHGSMLNWIKIGTEYHADHNLHDCLFCGNILAAERLTALKSSIEGRFKDLQNTITDLQDRIRSADQAITDAVAAAPYSNRDVAPHLEADFIEANTTLLDAAKLVKIYLDRSAQLLHEKSANPNMPLTADDLDESKVSVVATNFDLAIQSMNEIITRHNETFDKFSQIQESARKRIKEHFLAGAQARYSELRKSANDADDSVNAISSELESLKVIEQELITAVQTHGPVADVINLLLRGYLGREDLAIHADSEGFRITRNGAQITKGPLSEGEKTAISLCYFISKMKEEGKRLQDLIIVIDDPISSLDTKALNYAFSMIKGSLSRARQLIILTHNLPFMLSVKRWLIPTTEHGIRLRDLKPDERASKATSSLFFLETYMHADGTSRQAKLVPMNQLLREYDSEYHYLFSLLYSFGNNEQEAPSFLLMPNVMRKVLELFLAFKRPGNDGLSSKVEALANDPRINAARLRAIDRLVQLESHADSLDDFIGHSSLTVEETADAASSLLNIIETIDQDHFNKMRSLVQPRAAG